MTFSDGQGIRHHFEISNEVFDLFNAFELSDLSYLNEVDRHYEQSELTEGSLYDRAVHRPETQKRRLCLYYFEGLTYEQIGELEGCTFQAVAKSVCMQPPKKD